MAVFNFITIALGCINQLQPLFMQNRDIFETREKGSKTYHWLAFIAAQDLSEMPLLVLCGTLVFLCWYFAVGFPLEPRVDGQVYGQMLFKNQLPSAILPERIFFANNGLMRVSIRRTLYTHWLGDCSVQPECLLQRSSKPHHHRVNSHQFLRRRGPLSSDQRILAALALLLESIHLSS